jgi:hypothetical protein
VFTHWLVEGLRAGAPDDDGDGLVELISLHDYLFHRWDRSDVHCRRNDTPAHETYRSPCVSRPDPLRGGPGIGGLLGDYATVDERRSRARQPGASVVIGVSC